MRNPLSTLDANRGLPVELFVCFEVSDQNQTNRSHLIREVLRKDGEPQRGQSTNLPVVPCSSKPVFGLIRVEIERCQNLASL
jgi:hypothetical protein